MGAKAFKKDFSNLGLRMVACAIVINGIQIAAQLILMWVNADLIEDVNILLAATMIPTYAVGYPISFLILQVGSDRRRLRSIR